MDRQTAKTRAELFDVLREHGGSLFRGLDWKWQWTVEVEGREGRSHNTYGVGDTPEEAIMNHHLYEEEL